MMWSFMACCTLYTFQQAIIWINNFEIRAFLFGVQERNCAVYLFYRAQESENAGFVIMISEIYRLSPARAAGVQASVEETQFTDTELEYVEAQALCGLHRYYNTHFRNYAPLTIKHTLQLSSILPDNSSRQLTYFTPIVY